VKVYRSDGKSSQAPPPPGEIRHVDCVDCHNRPTHVFPAPDHSVNVAMYTGRMDPSLPWLKKVSVEALTGSYETRDEANRKIETYIRDFYRNLEPKMADPRRSAVHQAIEETKAIYNRSLFPEMKVDWRTHPDNIGHMIYDGCFRCHDAKHVSDDRESIRTECSVCHDFEQAVPVSAVAQVFRQTTLSHPVKLEGIHGQLKCSSCHTGGRAPRTSCAGCHETQSLFRQGKEPVLPGLQGTTPTVMADLDCDSCHDLQQPQTPAALAAQCSKCHDASYPDMLKTWKDEAAAGKAKAVAAIEDLKKGSGAQLGDRSDDLQRLIRQMEEALARIDRAGPHHNTDFADAAYQQVVKLSKEGLPKATAK
jgi:hypothetical protein